MTESAVAIIAIDRQAHRVHRPTRAHPFLIAVQVGPIKTVAQHVLRALRRSTGGRRAMVRTWTATMTVWGASDPLTPLALLAISPPARFTPWRAFS